MTAVTPSGHLVYVSLADTTAALRAGGTLTAYVVDGIRDPTGRHYLTFTFCARRVIN